MIDQKLLEDTRLLTDRIELLRRMPKGVRVAEVGVAAGEFSAEILKICNPSELHLIDPWVFEGHKDYSEASFHRVSNRFANEISSGQVTIHRGMSGEILPTFEDDFFDWVYVDAGHDYDSVREDLDLCYRVVKPDGLIAGHDYLRWVGPADIYGVVEAVNELATKTGSPFCFLTNQFEKHDSYALRLKKT